MNLLRQRIAYLTQRKSIPTFFKDNSMDFYKQYKNPDNTIVKSIPFSNMKIGGIYFVYYKDESNWMQLSPIVVTDMRDKRILFAINMNFLPLEIRVNIFDDIVMDVNNNNKQQSGMTPFHMFTFERAYKKLLRYGFEYALVEYEIGRIVRVFDINYDSFPQFLYHQHPKNIYDPLKLYQIWESKLKNRPERHNELIQKLVKDFYDVTDELIENSTSLKNHFQRLQRNQDKFGDKFG